MNRIGHSCKVVSNIMLITVLFVCEGHFAKRGKENVRDMEMSVMQKRKKKLSPEFIRK